MEINWSFFFSSFVIIANDRWAWHQKKEKLLN